MENESIKKQITIGSRESRLAVIQRDLVIEGLKKLHPETDFHVAAMKTTGDRILDKSLDKIGGKGLFVKELENAMREGRVDYAVHSLKDMPMEIPEDLPLLGCSEREDPRDVLVLPKGISEIDFSKPIGTSSKRRMLQMKMLYPQASFAVIRGNVETRLRKLDEGQYSAIILAAAGLKRLGLEGRISRYFEPEEILPAAGQGILTIQGRAGQEGDWLEGYSSEAAMAEALCERAFVRRLDGGCSSPIAAYAEMKDDSLWLRGLYVPEGSEEILTGEMTGRADQPEALGKALAEKLLGIHEQE